MKDWRMVKEGFVIQMKDGRFIWEILANGHPETPVIYFTGYLWEAKSWKHVNSAKKAAERVKAKNGECDVCIFRYDEASQARILGEAIN